MKNIGGIPENTEKGLQTIPGNSWPLHGVRGASSKPAFSRSCYIRCTSIFEFKFDRQMSSGANDQAKCLQFADFRDHG